MSATANEPVLPQDVSDIGQEEMTVTENVEQAMDTDTEVANQELELLQAIPELMEKVGLSRHWTRFSHTTCSNPSSV